MGAVFSSVDESKWGGSRHADQVRYDPAETLLGVFSRWRGTVAPLVLGKPMFWLLTAVHVLFLYMNEHVSELPSMDVSIVVGLPASLLIFLTVFYNGNCYRRFFELWTCTCELVSHVHSWVLQVAFIFDEMELGDAKLVRELKWKLLRRILSAMHVPTGLART